VKSIIKKVVVYSMVGLLQIGSGASIVLASPIHNDSQRFVQLNNGDHGRDHDRQRQHDERIRYENLRHEREMRRHDNESYRHWRDRQEWERRRHDDAMRDIAAILIGIAIGSANR
jgi:hypothetical protein